MREISTANRHPRLRLDRRAVERVIRTLDAHAAEIISGRPRRRRLGALPLGELSLVFLTDAALARLHADFLDDPSITDVITFEGDPKLGTAGEICVSADAAARQVGLPLAGRQSRNPRANALRAATAGSAKARRRTPALQEKFSAELTLYLVHGWLHLAGHDDLQPRKKRAMRRAEARAMKLIARERCLPRFQFAAKS